MTPFLHKVFLAQDALQQVEPNRRLLWGMPTFQELVDAGREIHFRSERSAAG